MNEIYRIKNLELAINQAERREYLQWKILIG
jgi:hypothetical protein